MLTFAHRSPRDEHIVKAVPDWKIKEISSHPSFQGIMDGDEAEMLLRETMKQQNRDCCHLTRYSDTREEHTLSVLKRKEDEGVIQNFHIIIEKEDDNTTTFEIFGSQKKFDSIAELLNFYKTNPLNHSIDSIGESATATGAQQTDEFDNGEQHNTNRSVSMLISSQKFIVAAGNDFCNITVKQDHI